METRLLGRSGLKVSVLSFGAMSFGGVGRMSVIGETQVPEAKRLIDKCFKAGVNLFDTADGYSEGRSEEILGEALGARRKEALIATKCFARTGQGPNDMGASRSHIIEACEASLKRLKTDYIDIYQMHAFDGLTPLEETLSALDNLVRAGKVRYIGCSNYSGWQLMKALAISDARNLERFVSHQIYYSLAGRDAEQELIPVALDQGVGQLIWSPLAGGALSGKFRRGQAAPDGTRVKVAGITGRADEEKVYDIVEVMASIAKARQVPISQIALNYVLAKPGVTSVIIGARNEQQLDENLEATAWQLGADEITQLDKVSATPTPYPNWHRRAYSAERNPR